LWHVFVKPQAAFSSLKSLYLDRVLGAHLPASAATGAFLLVDRVNLVGRHGNCTSRTTLGANRAADAFLSDAIAHQRLAPARRTTAGDVFFILMAEIAER
jgi:hypothetical protein